MGSLFPLDLPFRTLWLISILNAHLSKSATYEIFCNPHRWKKWSRHEIEVFFVSLDISCLHNRKDVFEKIYGHQLFRTFLNFFCIIVRYFFFIEILLLVPTQNKINSLHLSVDSTLSQRWMLQSIRINFFDFTRKYKIHKI